MNNASLSVGNKTSAVQATPGTGRTCFRKRKPRRCSADRSATSGAVSRERLDCMLRRTPGDDAHERPATLDIATGSYRPREHVLHSQVYVRRLRIVTRLIPVDDL